MDPSYGGEARREGSHGSRGAFPIQNDEVFQGRFKPRPPSRGRSSTRYSSVSTAEVHKDLQDLLEGQLNCFSISNDRTLYLKVAAADGLAT